MRSKSTTPVSGLWLLLNLFENLDSALVAALTGANSTRTWSPPVIEPAMSAKSLVASSTQAQSPWPCYSAPPLSRTAASGPDMTW